ncbi:MAG: bifunctional anthranilate synthase component I family protein/class IV aminotransferase [Rugosibacter sp.]|nr:bifunctional anthranilate synthase component I family protein/class IV aminotransferase [Rugosibacter sp.]
MIASDNNECFALLDDSEASEDQPRSRLYTEYVTSLRCTDVAALPALLEAMQQLQSQGLHAVGLFSFELGAALQGIVPSPGKELAHLLLFKTCQYLSATAVDEWLLQRASGESPSSTAGVRGITSSVSKAEFDVAMAQIHHYIEAGETYQVNYTYRLRFTTYGGLVSLYQRLKMRQPVPFGALISLPDGRAVLSFSPELAVQHQAGHLRTLPMKGTAEATDDEAQNALGAMHLANDPKTRAENVMIVDLLRNDLGRVAQLGTVHVPSLFNVARYGKVLQMTSTVEAHVEPTCSLLDLLMALLPAGSVTGAPKRRTLDIIHALETSPRGYYTGALGWFDAPHRERSMGDFCLSVPIRTLLLEAPDSDGQRRGEMGVGAGIVQDSTADAEFHECALKGAFLTGLTHEFELFETMLATEAGCPHLERHLQRLAASARYFDFCYDEGRVREAIARACAVLLHGSHRLRLALKPSGDVDVQLAPLQKMSVPVTVLLGVAPVKIDPLFLQHKTTHRADYDAAWQCAEKEGAFDMLFFNDQGELTEGARSSVFVKLAGRWYTPPLACGLLPGVMRSVLLADPAWAATEKVLTRNDLRLAQAVVVCNALRGALPAQIDWQRQDMFPSGEV